MLKYSLNDPIKLHPYLYVKANPINLIDPQGLACGPGKLGDYVVPDGFFETYSFSDACSNHDSCYGCAGAKAGKSKADCDDNFLRDMLNACASQIKPTMVNMKNHCDGMAWIYYNAVSKKGQSNFDKGRKK